MSSDVSIFVVMVQYLFVLTSKVCIIKDKKIKSMIVNMLKNQIHTYFSHNNNIKCVDSTIKYIDFKSIHYAINIDVVSSFMFLMILFLCFYGCIINLNY